MACDTIETEIEICYVTAENESWTEKEKATIDDECIPCYVYD